VVTATPPVVLAVDIGTSGIRTAAITPDGHIAAMLRRQRTGEDVTTFDPRALVTDAISLIRDLTSRLDPGSIAALACSGHVGTVILDRAGDPFGDAGSWSDPRGIEPLAAAWSEDPTPLYRTGRPSVTSSALALACWLRSGDPGRHQHVAFVLSPKDYLVYWLTGSIATDWTSACYTLGFDVRRRAWDSDLLAVGGLTAGQVPEPMAATAIAGRIHRGGAAATGLPRGLPVAVGGSDGTLGVAGAVGTDTGAVADIAGSTDVIATLVRDPPRTMPAGAVLNAYIAEGLWAVGGPTGATGSGADHIMRLAGFAGLDAALGELGPDIAAIPPGSGGLAVVPLLTGGRFPTWTPDERASIHGLSHAHGPAHLARAALEGAAFVVRDGIDRISASSLPVCMAGGTTRSELFCQLRADALGRRVAVCEQPDVSLIGAAAVAATAAGLHPSLAAAADAMRPPTRDYPPNPHRVADYGTAYEIWRWTRLNAIMDTSARGSGPYLLYPVDGRCPKFHHIN
jgi:sugar (pentulose or hexulose) kinase